MKKPISIFLVLTVTILKSVTAQNVIFNVKEYAGIEFHIEQETVENSDEIFLTLMFTNSTDSAYRILLKENIGFPLGDFIFLYTFTLLLLSLFILLRYIVVNNWDLRRLY